MSMAIRITVLTLFPELIENYVAYGVIGRACREGKALINTVDIRDFSADKHRTVDDLPCGGGAGMVLKPEPLALAMESVPDAGHRVLLTPSGRSFTQRDAVEWSKLDALTLVCGRYEGVDERFADEYIDDAVSIGDYVLSGGELGALVVLDAALRYVPGVLGNRESLDFESFSEGVLEHPQYTRPACWRGQDVPDVLLSGHHRRIEEWRRKTSLLRTFQNRRDLFDKADLTAEERTWLKDE
jgi:tRNA (guanine37-N1)-methyltransferase